MDNLFELCKKYKIKIERTELTTFKVERYGVALLYDEDELFSKPPKQVVKGIIQKVLQDPDYKAKTLLYVKGLSKKPIIMMNKSTILTIDDKKKLIREKLIKNGIL